MDPDLGSGGLNGLVIHKTSFMNNRLLRVREREIRIQDRQVRMN